MSSFLSIIFVQKKRVYLTAKFNEMNTYKIIFAWNEVLSCELLSKVVLGDEYYYEHDKGRLIYALVKAVNESDAISKCDKIIKEVTEKIFGSDFVT